MKNILIWGTGNYAINFMRFFDYSNCRIEAFVDNDVNKWGKQYKGIEILKPKDVKDMEYDCLFICSIYAREIKLQCIKLQLQNVEIAELNTDLLLKHVDIFNNKAFEIVKIKYLDKIWKDTQEIAFRNKYTDTVQGFEWMNEPISLSLGDWAIGYNYAYILSRVLDNFKPKNILELGLGQSSKIINAYVSYQRKKGKNINYEIVEQDENWIDFYERENSIEDITIYQRDIECINSEYGELNRYVDFSSVVKGKKYNFISIDGPWGGEKISRMDVYNELPQILDNEFVVLVDDYVREGEKVMVSLFEQRLRDNNISFGSRVYQGKKDIYIIVSSNLKFLLSMQFLRCHNKTFCNQ